MTTDERLTFRRHARAVRRIAIADIQAPIGPIDYRRALDPYRSVFIADVAKRGEIDLLLHLPVEPEPARLPRRQRLCHARHGKSRRKRSLGNIVRKDQFHLAI